MLNKAVMLDRDGTLNKDKGYVYKLEDFQILPGVLEALKTLQEHNFKLIIITNQSGIGRGYYIEQDFLTLNNQMLKIFKNNNITIDHVYYCPHSPEDNCECRKPKPKLALQAIKEFNLDTKKSWFIGDKIKDKQIAEACNLKYILIDSKYLKDVKLPKVKGLKEAVQLILKNE